MKIHEKYMRRCIELAKNGLGTTYQNPLVGCVIVHDNKVIGEGWHYQSGMPHAEVNAINSVKNSSLLKEVTIYVSLEPCSHFGKTPPCANLIIERGIKNVVIGSVDPNSKVAGNGIKLLKENGCNITQGLLENECKLLNKRFFTFHTLKRPYIILKWAETLDGFIAPLKRDEQKPVWITNTISRQLVHKWRAEEQAILVGTNTVIEDNPSLTTRDWKGNSPTRILIDRNLRIPENASVYDGKVKTIVITAKKSVISTTINDRFVEKNIHIETIKFSDLSTIRKKGEVFAQIFDILYRYKIQSVIVEGGTKTLQTFIDSNLWDEARVFTGNTNFKQGIQAPKYQGIQVSEEKLKDDTLKIYRND